MYSKSNKKHFFLLTKFKLFPYLKSNQNQIKKFYLKSVHFITVQHKLSRAFQTDMHNKIT
jgi:hypothetical protein